MTNQDKLKFANKLNDSAKQYFKEDILTAEITNSLITKCQNTTRYEEINRLMRHLENLKSRGEFLGEEDIYNFCYNILIENQKKTLYEEPW